jgi:hypothetical protein
VPGPTLLGLGCGARSRYVFLAVGSLSSKRSQAGKMPTLQRKTPLARSKSPSLRLPMLFWQPRQGPSLPLTQKQRRN